MSRPPRAADRLIELRASPLRGPGDGTSGAVVVLHDVTELREKIAWFLGKRKQMPRSPALGYPEKMEYIALMWGILVMTVTGFVLWFENWTLTWLPGWVPEAATVLHFLEAVLATWQRARGAA